MNILLEWLLALISGVPAFLTNPFTFVLLFLVALQWKRQVDMERKLFSARLHTVSEGIIQSVFYGLLGGIVVSILFIGIGVVFSLEPFLYLWFIAFFLMLFNVRYLCFAYAGAILGAAVVAVRWFPQGFDLPWLSPLWDKLDQIYLPSIFAIVAILHLAEALLVYLVGGQRGTPIFLQSKRGRLVGGYHIQHFWLVPIFVVVEAKSSTLAPLFQGWPVFSADQFSGFSLLLLPAVLAFSEQAVSSTPKDKARFSAKWLAVYSIILFAITLGSFYMSQFILLAILFSFIGHEALILYGKWREEQNSPIYVHPKEGIKILAVIPETPAKRMGLEAGEVIVRVNGIQVFKRSDLYKALKSNLAFCKLDVINNQGHLKFTKTSLYNTDHHQLGVILAPDEDVPYYLEQREMNLFKFIRQRLIKKQGKTSTESRSIDS